MKIKSINVFLMALYEFLGLLLVTKVTITISKEF